MTHHPNHAGRTTTSPAHTTQTLKGLVTRMFIKTRYFDNGRAEAKIIPDSEVTETTNRFSQCDNREVYIDECDTVEDWLEETGIELYDVVSLVLSMNDGGWVDITNYV